MFVRSPRRFALLSFIALVFILGVVQRSPWAQEKVYERIPSFGLGIKPADQEFLAPEGEGREQVNLEDNQQMNLGESWQDALPVPDAAPLPTTKLLSTSTLKGLPSPTLAEESELTKAHPPWVTAPSRVGTFIPPTPRPSNLKEYVKGMLNWDRPSWDGHWPPFSDYVDKGYDPNRWERFDM
jgi:hypothetical protein